MGCAFKKISCVACRLFKKGNISRGGAERIRRNDELRFVRHKDTYGVASLKAAAPPCSLRFLSVPPCLRVSA